MSGMAAEFDRDDDVFMLETDRLLLRGWHEDDLHDWIAMNADPTVRQYFPSVQSPEKSVEQALEFQDELVSTGFGLWAAEIKESVPYMDDRGKAALLPPATFIGFIGLHPLPQEVPSMTDGTRIQYEIGWRLAKEAWNQGLATEGARAVRDYAFGIERLPTLGSYTTAANAPSRRVMEKIGLHLECTFTHPALPEAQKDCVLYAMDHHEWQLTNQGI